MDAKTETYAYDFRDQLISGQGFTYVYDDIGNRTAAEGHDYTANSLNQYTAIDAFTPTYDLDGNQTSVLTETGVWQVEYNAENRPVRWTQGNTVVTMDYDRLGRRVFYKEMNGNRQVTYTKFLYDGYLCIQQLFSNSPWNVYKEFVWDPTEPVATRPLCFRQYGQHSAFLMHDGNKNVTNAVTIGPFNEPVAHYDYAPFGAPTASGPRAADNPFRFSSEFHDPTLALVYYNYRHYNLKDGRWLGRDRLSSHPDYIHCRNNSVRRFDYLGDLFVPTLVFYEVVELPRISLLEKRHGVLGAKGKQAPIAFTTGSPKSSPDCICNSAGFWEGTLSAQLTITTYIYDRTYDDRNAVTITNNRGKVGRDDVLRHEKEHAKDIEAMFREAFSILPFYAPYASKRDCVNAIRSLQQRLHSVYNNMTKRYKDAKGHGDAKYRKGGAFYATGMFK